MDLPVYRTRAVNTAPDSENKIHDNSVAAEYGFHGGLVPGITVYGYMTVPLVDFAPEWLEHGWMKVRFLDPFYDADEVIVRAITGNDAAIQITAERADGKLCATASAAARAGSIQPAELFPDTPLPEKRPIPSPANLIAGAPLGTIVEKVDDDPPPQRLLQLSNEILVRNFELGPWIHTASELTNWSRLRRGEELSARGRVVEQFERKGHQLVTVDVMLLANRERLLQTVRHTAIYRLRTKPE